jgi:uncharacterized protein YbjT (DUF2867 family)
MIAGATGLTGSEILKNLINNTQVSKLLVFTRKELNQQSQKIVNVLIEKFNDQIDINETVDVGVCSIGTTIKKAGSQKKFFEIDHDAIIEFAKLCKRVGVKKFILVSASGANANSRIFYNRVKGLTELDIIKMNFEALIIYRPGLLIGNRHENRPIERVAVNSTKILSKILPKKVINTFSTSIETLARCIDKNCLDSTDGIKIVEANRICDVTA